MNPARLIKQCEIFRLKGSARKRLNFHVYSQEKIHSTFSGCRIQPAMLRVQQLRRRALRRPLLPWRRRRRGAAQVWRRLCQAVPRWWQGVLLQEDLPERWVFKTSWKRDYIDEIVWKTKFVFVFISTRMQQRTMEKTHLKMSHILTACAS